MENTLDVWNIPAESATRVGHPAPFPFELPARLIELYTYRGDLVLDPFAGSGTAAVAAVRSGRHYVGYDLQGSYIQLAEALCGAGAAAVGRGACCRGQGGPARRAGAGITSWYGWGGGQGGPARRAGAGITSWYGRGFPGAGRSSGPGGQGDRLVRHRSGRVHRHPQGPPPARGRGGQLHRPRPRGEPLVLRCPRRFHQPSVRSQPDRGVVEGRGQGCCFARGGPGAPGAPGRRCARSGQLGRRGVTAGGGPGQAVHAVIEILGPTGLGQLRAICQGRQPC